MKGRAAAFLTAVVLLVSGCGSGVRAPSAAEQVPALGAALARIDTALAAHHFAAARDRLRALKAAVVDARDTGDLSDEEAQRILDAVAVLMATLPADDRAPSASPSSTTSATSSPSATTSRHPQRKPTTNSASAAPSSSPVQSSTPTPSPSTVPSPTQDASPNGAPTATP